MSSYKSISESEKKIAEFNEKICEGFKSSNLNLSPHSPHCSSSASSSTSPVLLQTNNNNSNNTPVVDKSMVPNISQQTLDIFERSNNNFLFPMNGSNGDMTSAAERYRLQFCNYAILERMRNQTNIGLQHLYQPFSECNSQQLAFSFFQSRVFQTEEPKPQHSYIGLIAMAILGAPDQKLVLSDIYQHILDNYPYFRSRGPG